MAELRYREADPDEAKRFLAVREQLGLSQRQFAEKLGTTSNHISRLERATRPPSAALLRRLEQLEQELAQPQEEPPLTQSDSHEVAISTDALPEPRPPAEGYLAPCECPDCERDAIAGLKPRHAPYKVLTGEVPLHVAEQGLVREQELKAEMWREMVRAARPGGPQFGLWRAYQPGQPFAAFRANRLRPELPEPD